MRAVFVNLFPLGSH